MADLLIEGFFVRARTFRSHTIIGPAVVWPKENSFPGCTIETGRADSIEAMLWDIPKGDGIVGVIVLD